MADEPTDEAIVQAVYQASTGTVVGFLQPHTHNRRIKLMGVSGPSGSRLQIFRGYNAAGHGVPINTVYPAFSRTYDADREGSPMDIWAGQAATFVWDLGSTAVGSTASANVTSTIKN